MKNYIYSTIVLFLISFNTLGQSPSWTVNENNFQYTMTFVGSLTIDGVRLGNANDKVAAFVNGECRGVSNLIYVATEKKYYAYLTVFSNSNNETVSFKMYDSANNIVKDVVSKASFASNANLGNLSLPYVFSNNALQKGADLLDLSFAGVTRNDISIVGNKVTVYLDPGQNITALNAIFTSSTGANVYIGNVQQVSGSNNIDFTNPVTFKGISEDQSTVKEWIVTVQLPAYPVTLPTVFTLSKLTIEENQPIGTVVGDFNMLIEDRAVTNLSLVNSDGGFDNASFEIIGNKLRVKSIFDFETKSSYKIRVQAISIRKEVVEKTFEITVLDDKLPTVFTLSKLTIDENKLAGTVVGDFTVVTENRTVFALTLIDGVGGEDNSSFEIVGISLKVKSIFDFETKSSYKIRVQAVSSRGDVLEQAFAITVLDDKLPTVFTLSKLTIDENKPVGTVVGDFTVVKEDRTVFALTLVDGVGADDNASFEITGKSLKVKSIFDFETKSSYKIRVQAVSSRGDVLDQSFTITVVDDNLPTVFTLSKSTIDENKPVGTVVGDFNVLFEDRAVNSLSFVNGDGGFDNASFEIIGNSLKVKSIFDFETKSSYKIRVQAISTRNEILEKTFEITVLDDKLPKVFTLSKLTIDENKPVGTVVGNFTVIKEDRTVFALTLVDGLGGEDNSSFEIIGSSLKVKSIFDFETKSSYKIRVQAVSSRGDVLEQSFTITVVDDNLPTVFTLSKSTIDENQPVGTVVGDFNVLFEDRAVSSLSFVNGDGGFDNASFEIIGNSLKVKSIFDFETKSSYKIRVQAISTRNEILEKTFEITVLDDKLPTVFTLSTLIIDENKPAGTVVGNFTVIKEDRTVFALTLVHGLGGEDNSSFEIIGNSLKVKSIFDFETKSSYKIRVKAVSSRGDVLEQSFTITVVDDNLPTVFTLSKSTIDENQAVGTVVGNFTVIKEDRAAFALTLVDGVGADDNASFEITGNTLKARSVFDFETKSNYKIRVQAVSSRGDVLEQSFTVTVVDDNLPTVFTLSKSTIDENQAVGTVVGNFTVIKEDRTAFALTLVDGVGADDNASFEITGNSLKARSVFDFETKSNYKIRVQAVSSRGDVLEQSFTITVVDDNLPTVFTLSKSTIDENQAVGTVVGNFTVIKEDRTAFALTLVDGVGADDNASFEITGNSLKVKGIFDFETKSIYKIRVKAVSSRGDVLEQSFTITVLNDNLPTVFTLSKLVIDENKPVGSVVGNFTLIKEDRNAFSLTLVEGVGADDNASFEIAGNSLKVKSVFDFEAKSIYKIRVQAVSSRGDVLEQSFTITVLDDKLPTVFTLSKLSIDENQPIATLVGAFTVIKENRTVFALALVDGVGGDDNASFEITGNSLKSKEMFDFETKNSYKIRIKAENTLGEILFATFNIAINDINDTPVLITLSNNTVKENLPAGTVIGTLTTKDQDRDSCIYSFFIAGSDYLNFDLVGDHLVLKKSLDFETQHVFQFELISNDQRGGEVKEKMTVFAVDVNENPVIVKTAGSSTIDFVLSELSNKVVVVGKIEATDVDEKSSFSFEIVSDQQVPFTINNDGIISFDGTINADNKTSYSFTLKVTDNGSPKLSDTVIVNVTIEFKINDTLMFNNLVSPNGDGYNDRLLINNIHLYSNYIMAIYNSKGQIVFSTSNYKNDWNGGGLPEGEYYLYFTGKDQGKKEYIYKELVRLVYN